MREHHILHISLSQQTSFMATKARDNSKPSADTAGVEKGAAPPVPARRGRKPHSSGEVDPVVVSRMRRGKHRGPEGADEQQDENAADRQFVVALARGLRVLSAYKAKDAALGNSELADRTGIPAATVSRITHTLTKLGYLSFDEQRETYDLGGSSLALGHTALARISLRRVALPLMQQLAARANANVGLGMRDRKTMLYVETCEGSGPVGLRLHPGSRIPIASSAMGRAYLSAMPEAGREALLEELAPQFGDDWATVRRGVDRAMRDISRMGFCTSMGEWQKDIHGVAVPLVDPVRNVVYAINLGGPAYMLSERDILEEYGPMLLEARNHIARTLGPA
jgi:DNA-binding IclR family transcriptional regulator